MFAIFLLVAVGVYQVTARPECKNRDDVQCVRSVRIGYCTSSYYKDYMQQNCARACFFCTPSTEPKETECEDTYPDTCPKLTQDCHRAYRPWMAKHCRKSCKLGVCIPSTLPPTTQPSPPTRPARSLSPQQSCGQPQVRMSRVIAGTDAVKGQWPWQILMLKNGRPGCGGTLVANNWVVTAAHCVAGDTNNPWRFTIRVGEHDGEVSEGTELDVPVERVISHSWYNRRTLDYDIALFKLKKPVQFNKWVQPACLPTKDLQPGTECYITGFGKIKHPGSMHTILQQARMPIVSNSQCYAKNRKILNIPITPRMICGGEGGINDISGCHDDSGGPFVCRVGGRWELHGDVSHGSPRCKSTETYTVFARTMFFRSWIERNIQYN